MTPRERRNWKILYFGVIPAAVFAVDVAIYIHINGWHYNVEQNGRAAFWPGVLFFGTLFFPITAAALANAIFEFISARMSTHWPVVDGRVTASAVKTVEHSRRGWVGWETYYTYRPEVVYEYEAAGQQYKNDLIAFGLEPFETREDADAMLGSYPRGARVRVHYDPDDPQSSVLQMTGGWAFHAILSAIIGLLTVFWLVITLIMSR